MKKVNLNFGILKEVYSEILAETISTRKGEGKVMFKEYVKSLSENEVLKTQFHIHSNIENTHETNEMKAIDFIKENIALMDKFTKEEITEANTKLALPLIYESLDLYKVSEDKKELHENISKLIMTKKSGETIKGILETISKVADFMIKNEPKSDVVVEGLSDIVLSNSELASLMVSKYHERYSSLDESQRDTIKKIIDSPSEDRESLYMSEITECLTLVNTKIDEGVDVDTKESLLNLKENLLGKKYIAESFDEDIIMVLELKENLK